jgi:hypothetical protein
VKIGFTSAISNIDHEFKGKLLDWRKKAWWGKREGEEVVGIAVNLRYWQNGAGPKSIWVHRAGGQKGKK